MFAACRRTRRRTFASIKQPGIPQPGKVVKYLGLIFTIKFHN